MKCRFDSSVLSNEFVDLGHCPPSNAYLKPDELGEAEIHYPLKLYVNEHNFLVQVDECKRAEEIFGDDYAYFSSFSLSWLRHAEEYVNMMIYRFELSSQNQIVELASNDGYLLQYFQAQGIPVLGVEPSSSVAKAALAKGIDTIVKFFGVKLARRMKANGMAADLIVGNNVLAHVPDLNDFVAGIKILLKTNGVLTMEFPHLMKLVDQVEFDTIYHEHYSYYSFYTVSKIFEAHGMELFDVEEIPTHGGSLRIYGQHTGGCQPTSPNVSALLEQERDKGMQSLHYYQGFQQKVDRVKIALLKFLIEQKIEGRSVVGYGAAAKGNTLLNFCGVRSDLIQYVVDACDHKQGRYMPGSHIPIVDESRIRQTQPDFVIILPWNLKDEIVEQLEYIREWGGRFVTAIPKLDFF
jgi:SAM-dependent methyltransferase